MMTPELDWLINISTPNYMIPYAVKLPDGGSISQMTHVGDHQLVTGQLLHNMLHTLFLKKKFSGDCLKVVKKIVIEGAI